MQLVAPLRSVGQRDEWVRSLRRTAKLSADAERDLSLLSIDAAFNVDEEFRERCLQAGTKLKETLRDELAMMAFAEALLLAGVQRFSEIPQRAPQIFAAADSAAGFSVMEFLPGRQGEPVARTGTADELQVPKIVDALVQHMRPRLRSFPMQALALFGDTVGLPALAYDCRVLFERLSGLLQRLAPEAHVALNELGRLYLAGKVEISSAAKILGRPVEDVVVDFERLGFVRGLEQISMSPDVRSERLTAIAKLVRRGNPSRDLVRREAIASQRIENVDARMHLLDRR